MMPAFLRLVIYNIAKHPYLIYLLLAKKYNCLVVFNRESAYNKKMIIKSVILGIVSVSHSKEA